MSEKNKGEVFWGGLLLGSAIGTLVGLLVAPRTGQDTRKVIKKTADALPEIAEDFSTTLAFHAQRVSHSTEGYFNYTKERLKVAIASGIKATQESMKKNNG